MWLFDISVAIEVTMALPDPARHSGQASKLAYVLFFITIYTMIKVTHPKERHLCNQNAVLSLAKFSVCLKRIRVFNRYQPQARSHLVQLHLQDLAQPTHHNLRRRHQPHRNRQLQRHQLLRWFSDVFCDHYVYALSKAPVSLLSRPYQQ